MIEKSKFISRILQKIEKDLNRILPEQETLDEMYDKLKDYFKEEFCK